MAGTGLLHKTAYHRTFDCTGRLCWSERSATGQARHSSTNSTRPETIASKMSLPFSAVAAVGSPCTPVVVQRPYVLADLCIGCGICEYQCPVEGQAAVEIYRAWLD